MSGEHDGSDPEAIGRRALIFGSATVVASVAVGSSLLGGANDAIRAFIVEAGMDPAGEAAGEDRSLVYTTCTAPVYSCSPSDFANGIPGCSTHSVCRSAACDGGTFICTATHQCTLTFQCHADTCNEEACGSASGGQGHFCGNNTCPDHGCTPPGNFISCQDHFGLGLMATRTDFRTRIANWLSPRRGA